MLLIQEVASYQLMITLNDLFSYELATADNAIEQQLDSEHTANDKVNYTLIIFNTSVLIIVMLSLLLQPAIAMQLILLLKPYIDKIVDTFATVERLF